MEGYKYKKGIIEIERDLTELDLFVMDFLKSIEEYSDYLIVSGFVSIVCGRTRATEDVDILVPITGEENFKKIFDNLEKNKFWCYQAESPEKAYEYFKNKESLRFARKEQIFPNMEVIPIDEARKSKWFEFSNPQKLKIGKWEIKIPMIEFEITYKEKMLGGEKDLQDARHLREFFKDILRKENFKKCDKIIEEEKEALK